MSAPKTPRRKETGEIISVRRIHRRDLNRTWEFLKLVFRIVNKSTLEYQRPRTKARFMEVYDTEDTEQLLFESGKDIVGYAECSYSPVGADNWMNPRYFDKRGMRPLFVDELAVHPQYQGRGVGSYMLDQLQQIARVHGCTHLVLEVAQNNKDALKWYHKRKFFRLDAAIFLAQRVPQESELLPSRALKTRHAYEAGKAAGAAAKVVVAVARAVPNKKAVPEKAPPASKQAAKPKAAPKPKAKPVKSPAPRRPAPATE